MRYLIAAILCLILGLSFTINSVNAQPTIIAPSDTVFAALDTLNALHSGEISLHWDVVNESNSEMTLMCTRNFIETVDPYNYPYVQSMPEALVEGAYEKFCWGPICYNYGADASSQNPSFLVNLPPGATDITFIAYYYPHDVLGTTTIEYCFHPVDNQDAGSCQSITYVIDAGEIFGCTTAFACNYDPQATQDDGSCLYFDECGVCGGAGIPEVSCDCDGNVLDVVGVCGGDCTDDNDGDGVCDELEVYGCTYPDAMNFDSSATIDDGSCLYDDVSNDCPADLDGDGAVTTQDLLSFLSFFGEICE
jgi:hypothetical protein